MVVDKNFCTAFGHAYAAYTKAMEKEKQKKGRFDRNRVKPVSRSRGKSRSTPKHYNIEAPIKEKTITPVVQPEKGSRSSVKVENKIQKTIPVRSEIQSCQLPRQSQSPIRLQESRSRSRSNSFRHQLRRSQRQSATPNRSDKIIPELKIQSQSSSRLNSYRSRSRSNSLQRHLKICNTQRQCLIQDQSDKSVPQPIKQSTCPRRSQNDSYQPFGQSYHYESTSIDSLKSKIEFYEYERERRLEEQERKKLIEARKKLNEDRKKLDEMKKQFEEEKAKYFKEQQKNRKY